MTPILEALLEIAEAGHEARFRRTKNLYLVVEVRDNRCGQIRTCQEAISEIDLQLNRQNGDQVADVLRRMNRKIHESWTDHEKAPLST